MGPTLSQFGHLAELGFVSPSDLAHIPTYYPMNSVFTYTEVAGYCPILWVKNGSKTVTRVISMLGVGARFTPHPACISQFYI
jgi:hypothetical protein